MIPAATVLAAMLALPGYEADRATEEERAALYTPIAEAIGEASRSPSEAALLVSLSWFESKWAANVISGRCDLMPAGQRCDEHRGVFRARGVFQLHLAACREAYTFPEASRDSIFSEARCAIRLLRWGGKLCRDSARTPAHGAFGMYAGRGCKWQGAEARVRTAEKVLRKSP